MRIENWEKSRVTGHGEKGSIREEVLHRRGDDPMVMAFRRNHALAGCNKVEVDTEEVFTELRMEDAEMERQIRKEKDRREWDWIGGGRFSLVLD